MELVIGCDHAAIDAKTEIVQYLKSLGHDIIDEGTHSLESVDYPDYAAKVSQKVQSGVAERGILICGTGLGMSIAANRFQGIRAALCFTEELAELSRLHNDANVLCLGARTQSVESMKSILSLWLTTEWEGDRHARRLNKIELNSRGQDAE
ncbi:MAG: ribose 5-phosphate isomerase B [Candidatus Marinimicrobia bacterium]|jgi:ribose 5-phosphate isomerase B|nr:ribose 5-phosphate isomerase B [Candidatus Neomarinimicrobiota bacterium]MBT4362313.1 ribose 5-phosphate isomerase B [Candidatus Neomarinimicrobiota bacterium]MBT4715756.1 ribose 5-phosphate isomerase B [Candidatus Neomarinimicrobiota bacterium]MBT4947667.1 ribose 5-phosphate isomerase B [Candidatus Neomarinimicrobiota bacterium]MBT5269804.1 ribose 5-phosphate isomerase B [Candidatus Neomarinimicrobiota bacterium]